MKKDTDYYKVVKLFEDLGIKYNFNADESELVLESGDRYTVFYFDDKGNFIKHVIE